MHVFLHFFIFMIIKNNKIIIFITIIMIFKLLFFNFNIDKFYLFQNKIDEKELNVFI